MNLDTTHDRLLVGLRSVAAFAAVVAAFATAGYPPVLVAQSSSCRVTTAQGDVQGLARGGTCTYLSIPYAAAPAGNLRWRPPQPRAPWAPAILDATLPRQCSQLNLNTGAVQGVEDCLVLNVWVPAAAAGAPRPVLVWLHTGGFQATSANFAASDATRFAAERGVIVVAPNYRLGPLGFLAHASLTAEDPNYPSSGNYGIADQRAGLQWVRQHIAAFGGDPSRVTLAGTSAGAESTSLHLVSPASRVLFQQAIMQSGISTRRASTTDEGEDQGAQLATAIGCTTPATVLACMRAAPVDSVLRALPQRTAQILEDGRVDWKPLVDGFEIPDQPRDLLRRGLFNRVPTIIGVNGDEGLAYVDRSFPGSVDALQYERTVRTEFGMDADAVLRQYPATSFPTLKDALAAVTGDAEFVCEARRTARALTRDGAPVFFYSFEYAVQGIFAGRAVHGVESNVLFGNDYAVTPNLGVLTPRPLTPADQRVYDTMSTFWQRFIETGDPNPRGVPTQWPPYQVVDEQGVADLSRSNGYIVFADRPGVRSYLRDSQCNFWESFFFRSALGPVPAAAR